MRFPKFKLLGGIALVIIASALPSVFLTEVLSETTDTVIGGFNLAGTIVQLVIISIGAVGASMIKDTLFRSKSQKRRY